MNISAKLDLQFLRFLSKQPYWRKRSAHATLGCLFGCPRRLGYPFAGTCGAFVGRALASQHWCCSFEHPAGDLCALCQSVQQLASCSNGSTGNKQSAGTDLDTVVRHTRHS
ncbi:hypothetical protein ABBQ38_013834 [Trebouxia sp. C0009 RCD-2024]